MEEEKKGFVKAREAEMNEVAKKRQEERKEFLKDWEEERNKSYILYEKQMLERGFLTKKEAKLLDKIHRINKDKRLFCNSSCLSCKSCLNIL